MADRIMDHTAHHSVAMVRVYSRRAEAFADHAGEGLLSSGAAASRQALRGYTPVKPSWLRDQEV